MPKKPTIPKTSTMPKKSTIHVPEDNGGECSASTSRQFTTILPNREDYVKSLQKMDTIIISDSDVESEHSDDTSVYSDYDTSEEESEEGPPMKKAKMNASMDDGGGNSSDLIRQFSQEIIDETGAIITSFTDKEKLVEELQNSYSMGYHGYNGYKGRPNSSKSTCVVIGCNKFAKVNLCPTHLYLYREIIFLTFKPMDSLIKYDAAPDVGEMKELALKTIRAKLQGSTTSRVYVGITNNFKRRMKEHQNTKHQDSEELLIKCNNKKEAMVLEYEVIAQLSKELNNCRIVNRHPSGQYPAKSYSTDMVLYALYFNEPDPNWKEPKFAYTCKILLNDSLRAVIFSIEYQLPTLQCKPSRFSVMKLLGLECVETPRLKAKKAKRLDVLARISVQRVRSLFLLLRSL